MASDGDKPREPIFRDIRRYYCEFCGICRSKKALINAHIMAHHEEERKEKEKNGNDESEKKLNVCEDCGVIFQKPAHLKQHMQSHSLERPFACTVVDCNSSYRRKDHLNRHLLQHEGKLFECSSADCKLKFAYQGNMTRHVKEMHEEESALTDDVHQKEFVCGEEGCGKVFKYLSKLRKHEDSHVKLESVEAYCAEPECMKYFTNEQCLREHIRTCHQYLTCEKCGSKQLKKNIKRHMRIHEGASSPPGRIKCTFEGCTLTFSTASNLNQHVKAVHFELTPYCCGFAGCGMKFAFKHVRDKHEKSGLHVFTPGDFEESDEQFRAKPRGGRKRSYPVIETLMRKRVVLPSQFDICDYQSVESEAS